MEDVLALYEKPHQNAEPVGCLDEKPVCLHADVRPARPARPGYVAKRDNEYKPVERQTFSPWSNPKRAATSIEPLPTVRLTSSLWCCVILQRPIVSPQDSRRHGQSQHPLPQIADRLLRRTRRQLCMESSSDSLHTQAWQLAEPSRNRTESAIAPMPGKSPPSRPGDSPKGSPRLECSRQSRQDPHPMGVYPQSRSIQVRLQTDYL